MTKKIEIQRKIKELKEELASLSTSETAIKVLLNSGYGAFANEYFLFSDFRLARSITYTSQLVIKWIEKYLLDRNVKTIYIDTDSLFLTLNDQLESFCNSKNISSESLTFDQRRDILNKFKPKIFEMIKEGFVELSKVLNVVSNTFDMKLEILGDRGIWLGKKNYFIRMLEKDGIKKTLDDDPYVKGFDVAKRSSTPQWIIDSLNEYIKLVFMGETKKNLLEFETSKFEEFKKLPLNDIFSIKSVSSFSSYHQVTDKGAPAHVKGALVYNSIVETEKVESTFPRVFEGSRVKFCYVEIPNKFSTNTIAVVEGVDVDEFMSYFSQKYGITVDHEKQWKTIFIKPVRRITLAIGLTMPLEIKKTVDFSSLFD